MLHEHDRGSVFSSWVSDSEETQLIPILGRYLMALMVQALVLCQLEKVFEKVWMLAFKVLFAHPTANFFFSRIKSQDERLLMQILLEISFTMHRTGPRAGHLVARIERQYHLMRRSLFNFFFAKKQETRKLWIKQRLWRILYPTFVLEVLAAL